MHYKPHPSTIYTNLRSSPNKSTALPENTHLHVHAVLQAPPTYHPKPHPLTTTGLENTCNTPYSEPAATEIRYIISLMNNRVVWHYSNGENPVIIAVPMRPVREGLAPSNLDS